MVVSGAWKFHHISLVLCELYQRISISSVVIKYTVVLMLHGEVLLCDSNIVIQTVSKEYMITSHVCFLIYV